ncbi:MAG: CBS domain-containing protein [Saprospirales bacterium]|jgi:acetoin utilization protein AcuB|nr:MAG: CBS domain-containing protein [Saprospirales bacterium]
MNEPISKIMTTNLITASPEVTLDKIKDIFQSRKIHHLPITKNGHIVGLITTSDLLWLNRPFDEYPKIRAKEVMTTKIAKMSPYDKIGSAADIFLRNWFHAIPIVDDEQMLVGIVTTFDILKYNYSQAYPDDPVNY